MLCHMHVYFFRLFGLNWDSQANATKGEHNCLLCLLTSMCSVWNSIVCWISNRTALMKPKHSAKSNHSILMLQVSLFHCMYQRNDAGSMLADICYSLYGADYIKFHSKWNTWFIGIEKQYGRAYTSNMGIKMK